MKKLDSIPFLDLAFCLAFGFVLLYTTSVLMIKEQIKKADIETKAEYIVSLTWQDGIDHDVDVWVKDPQENVLFFRDKEVGIMHLDRDDVGNRNDIYEESGEIRIAPTNQEIVTIRGFITGEWVINTHFYRVGDFGEKVAKCNLVVTKLNPTSEVIANKYFTLYAYWEEQTIVRFLMTSSGQAFLQETIPISLVNNKLSVPAAYDNDR